MWTYTYPDELYHYGVKGMRWRHKKGRVDDVSTNGRFRRSQQPTAQSDAARRQARKAKAKKAAIAGATVAATALAVYGGYKANKYIRTKNGEIAAKQGFDYAEKMFHATVSGVAGGPPHAKISGTINANSGSMARSFANRASNDNFRTAAKNVYNYRKSGGNLNMLESVDSIARRRGSSITFGR